MNIKYLHKYEDAIYMAILATIQASYADDMGEQERLDAAAQTVAAWSSAARKARALIIAGAVYE